MRDILLLGAGGHAKSVVDVIEQSGIYNILGFLDYKPINEIVYKNYRVIGTDQDLNYFYNAGVRSAFITVGFTGHDNIRQRLYNRIKTFPFNIPTFIDESAILAADIEVKEGSFIGKMATINSAASIGRMCIINTGAIVEHESVIKDFSHVAVGAILCGQTVVDTNSFIGAGATIIQQIKIGPDVIIGAGSVVTRDVIKGKTVTGIPAREVR